MATGTIHVHVSIAVRVEICTAGVILPYIIIPFLLFAFRLRLSPFAFRILHDAAAVDTSTPPPLDTLLAVGCAKTSATQRRCGKTERRHIPGPPSAEDNKPMALAGAVSSLLGSFLQGSSREANQGSVLPPVSRLTSPAPAGNCITMLS